MDWDLKTREVELRLVELVARTHPEKLPENGEPLVDAMHKIADVIEDLQQQVNKLKLGVC